MEQNFPKSSQLLLESLTACLLTLCNLELKTSALISSLSERKINEEEKSQYKKRSSPCRYPWKMVELSIFFKPERKAKYRV